MNRVVALCGVAVATVALADPLTLNIDLANQTFDWVDGTSITSSGGFSNVFGTTNSFDVIVTSPTPVVTGTALVGSFTIDLGVGLQGQSVIEGLAIGTTTPEPTMFAGDAAGPAAGTFSKASFASLLNVAPGSYSLASAIGNWDDGVLVNVVVPGPSAGAAMLGGLVLMSRRRR